MNNLENIITIDENGSIKFKYNDPMDLFIAPSKNNCSHLGKVIRYAVLNYWMDNKQKSTRKNICGKNNIVIVNEQSNNLDFFIGLISLFAVIYLFLMIVKLVFKILIYVLIASLLFIILDNKKTRY